MTHIQFFGYNAFKIQEDDLRIIIDPGRNLKWNKLNSLIPKQEWDVDYIFITHEHDDHADFAIKIAKHSDAKIICHMNLQPKYSKKLPKDRVIGLNPDIKTTLNGLVIETFSVLHGKATIRILKRKFTISPKSSSLGFSIFLTEKSLMNLGDTIFLPEWKDNPPPKHPDILMIPTGGQMTMDPIEASEFVKVVKPKVVIPCHYRWHILFYKRRSDISLLRKTCEENDIIFKEMIPREKWEY
ncbi:MAG: MBL fold metallo-hydrolase [Candidatus Heimdallarchaeota archaeon]|nr:MAG: MBL fold metallo-hydrolase [Candidatus Heimdallarchaeota archaeon]